MTSHFRLKGFIQPEDAENMHNWWQPLTGRLWYAIIKLSDVN